MPQPMTPAPDAGQGLRKAGRFAREIARLMASAISPQPNTLGAMGVAGIRSMLPGGGSYEQERERYTDAAAPSDSVLDTVPALPGEDLEASLRRRFSDSPAHQRALMEGGSMAAPLAVHASPVKWSGQPTRAKVGTGEGGAAYGEGLYATVPSNAKGIDERYRVRQGLDTTPAITIKGEDIRSASMPADAHYYLGNEVRSFLEGKAKTLNPEDALFWARTKLKSQVDWTRKAMEEMRAKGHMQAVENHAAQLAEKEAGLAALEALTPADIATHVPGEGSFHVWDVPDRLMDYDAPLSKQPEWIKPAIREHYKGSKSLDSSEVGTLGAMSGARFSKDLALTEGIGRHLPSEEAARAGSDYLVSKGIQGHTYAGEAGSARTSGIEGDVPNFVIYDDAAVKPLGTFGSADEFLASDLYKQLKARIDAEDALRKAGKATPEAYAQIRAMFGGSP